MIIQPSKEVIGQICEITGVTEDQAKSAYQVSDGDVTTAVKVLGEASNMNAKTKGEGTGRPQEEVIEITDDNSEDLARAIALSLEEAKGEMGSAVSVEERDISRALEASLQDQGCGKRKRGGSWMHFTDPENPHDRARKDGNPVGLKNVGNTCWFSAVIQSLFHLPKFRQLVLQCKCPEDPALLAEKPKLAFLSELQKLFTLLLYSKRKYVDPSRAIEILQETMSSSGRNGASEDQQDANEFTHVLFDWLEEAFNEIGSSEGDSENPVRSLFYGKYSVDGLYNGGKRYHGEETFGILPLQVRGYCNIYDSLDNAMVSTNLDNSADDAIGPTERWFTSLPIVLPLSLSRFLFNQETGKTEKLHDEWKFMEKIFLSRYLEENKRISRERMKTVNVLKERRKSFIAKLENYIAFGSGPKKAPIVSVLDATVEFINAPTRMDVNCDSPMMVSPQSSPKLVAKGNKKRSGKLNLDAIMEAADKVEGPSPKSVNGAELALIENCLKRWRTEAEEEAKALKTGVDVIDEKISNAYHEDVFKMTPYRLHAILVHEGQASRGHYWAFVHDPTHDKWQKFNDINVAEVSWDELYRESVGGYRNTSAYCLLYVKATRADVYSPNYKFDPLSQSLRKYLREHNVEFMRELQEWDRSHNIAPSSSIDEVEVTPFGSSLLTELDDASLLEVKYMSQEQHIKVNNTLNERLREQLRQIIMVSKVNSPVTVDPRLEHVGVYLVKSKAPDYVTERGMLESYVERETATDDLTLLLKKVALQRLSEFRKKEPEQQEEYEEWKRKYNQFLKIRACFIEGGLAYYRRRFSIALPYFAHACELNKKAQESTSTVAVNVCVAMDDDFLMYYRRQCAKLTNMEALELFKSAKTDGVMEAKAIIMDGVAPILPKLMCSESQEDVKTSEELRQKWFDLLSQETLNARRQKHLEDMLTKLVQEDGDELVPIGTPIKVNDLGRKYTKVMQSVANDKNAPKITQ